MNDKDNILGNLPPFYVGQKVQYVGNRIDGPKETIRVVQAIVQIPCGCWAIDVGETDSVYARLKCSTHHKCTSTRDFISWYAAEAWKPLQQQTFPLMKFEKIKESSPEILIPN